MPAAARTRRLPFISEDVIRMKLRKLEPHLFLLPSYIVLIAFMGYPLVNCVRISFLHYQLTRPNDIAFAAFANYAKIFAQPEFPMILGNTVKYVALSVALQFALGFMLALALKTPFKGRNAYQGAVFLPWAISGFVVGLTFQWMFNGEFGVINDLLLKMGLVQSKIAFLGSMGTALGTVVFAQVWVGFVFFAIMLLAALQSVDKSLYEAATVDGAGALRKFLSVTIPSIKPTITVTILLRIVWVFNNAELIYIMTRGGPANSSNTLASYMFMKAYASLDFGLAGALGVLFMLALTVFSLLYFKFTRFMEGGESL
jgi:multiple sugar transport system permease protein